jgi:hypothetical protein
LSEFAEDVFNRDNVKMDKEKITNDTNFIQQ